MSSPELPNTQGSVPKGEGTLSSNDLVIKHLKGEGYPDSLIRSWLVGQTIADNDILLMLIGSEGAEDNIISNAMSIFTACKNDQGALRLLSSALAYITKRIISMRYISNPTLVNGLRQIHLEKDDFFKICDNYIDGFQRVIFFFGK